MQLHRAFIIHCVLGDGQANVRFTFLCSSCVGVEEEEAPDIDIYHCPNCEKTHGKSTCKYPCAASSPHTAGSGRLDNRSLLFWSLQKAHLSTMCHKYWNSNQSVRKDVSGRKLGAGWWSFGCSLRHMCELRQGTRLDSCSPQPHNKRVSLLA